MFLGDFYIWYFVDQYSGFTVLVLGFSHSVSGWAGNDDDWQY